MDEVVRSIHPAALDPDRLLADCDVRFTRRSGPGGQHRNKVESAAILTHRPTGLSAEANERRSQGQNREVALRRLRLILALEVRGPVGVGPGGETLAIEPSETWRARLKGSRILINPEHDDFPALLAEALDVITAFQHDVKVAAGLLGCSTSQLTRFLKDEPRAFALVNTARRERGLHPLR